VGGRGCGFGELGKTGRARWRFFIPAAKRRPARAGAGPRCEGGLPPPTHTPFPSRPRRRLKTARPMPGASPSRHCWPSRRVAPRALPNALPPSAGRVRKIVSPFSIDEGEGGEFSACPESAFTASIRSRALDPYRRLDELLVELGGLGGDRAARRRLGDDGRLLKSQRHFCGSGEREKRKKRGRRTFPFCLLCGACADWKGKEAGACGGEGGLRRRRWGRERRRSNAERQSSWICAPLPERDYLSARAPKEPHAGLADGHGAAESRAGP